MTFTCAHKGYTAAANHPCSGYLGHGNVYSGVQTSSFIRPYSRTECNGMTFMPGRLRDYDLETFRNRIPMRVLDETRIYTRTQSAILYQFFHFCAGKRIEHGWILTDTDNAMICDQITGPTWRSSAVIAACRDYLKLAEARVVAA